MMPSPWNGTNIRRLMLSHVRSSSSSRPSLSRSAAALPGEHRAAEPRLPGRGARRAKAPIAVQQQLPRHLRHAEIQERIDIQLVPEHMTPVGLAVKAAGGYPSVPVRRVAAADLED